MIVDGQMIISIGSSLAWHRSWALYFAPNPASRWTILELVIFGYGVRVKRLQATKHEGMLPSTFKVSVYWGWKPWRAPVSAMGVRG